MLVLTKGILYLQIYEYFKKEIIAGYFQPGEKLPSKRAIARDYHVALNTVEGAYAKLEEEGFIEGRERQGYFVRNIQELYIAPQKRRKQVPKPKPFLYDFSHAGVAREGFPDRALRRATMALLDDQDLLMPVDYQGDYGLRYEICRYLERSRGVLAEPEDLIISSGTEYLLQIVFTLLEGTYGIEDPGFPMLKNILTARGVPFVSLPLDEDGVSYEAVRKSGVDYLMATPAHQFPTGCIMGASRRSELLNLASLKYIIEDDYDSEFKFSNRPVAALKSMDYQDKVIYMGSFSKSLSPSLRVSYMVLPRRLMASYRENYHSFICPVSILVQKVLKEFIQSGEFEKHLNRMRRIYGKKRRHLVDLIKQRPDLTIQGADAGLTVVVQFPKGYDEMDLIRRAQKAGLKVEGLSQFGQPAKKATLVLGFANLTEKEMTSACHLLLSL